MDDPSIPSPYPAYTSYLTGRTCERKNNYEFKYNLYDSPYRAFNPYTMPITMPITVETESQSSRMWAAEANRGLSLLAKLIPGMLHSGNVDKLYDKHIADLAHVKADYDTAIKHRDQADLDRRIASAKAFIAEHEPGPDTPSQPNE